MSTSSSFRIIKQLEDNISDTLTRAGLLYRIFARVKSPQSVEAKLQVKRGVYTASNRKMQDPFGIRIVLYFAEDSKIAQRAVKKLFSEIKSSSTIDTPDKETFGPTRCNLVFRLPDDVASEFLSELKENVEYIDTTFEVQFRTLLSEGWHEVEHDFRYKCKDHWEEFPDLYRAMNGLIATLETCDWTMGKLFDDLAYRHYKKGNWSAMISSRFRLRIQGQTLSTTLSTFLDNNRSFAKELFRINRERFVSNLLDCKLSIPLTHSNLVFIANRLFIKNESCIAIELLPLKSQLDEYLQQH